MTTLASSPANVYHVGTMVRHEKLTGAVRRLVDVWPSSLRDLASRAGIPHVTLVKITKGRLGGSPDVARRILAALDEWVTEQRTAIQDVSKAGRQVARELQRADVSHGTEDRDG